MLNWDDPIAPFKDTAPETPPAATRAMMASEVLAAVERAETSPAPETPTQETEQPSIEIPAPAPEPTQSIAPEAELPADAGVTGL